MSDSVMLQADIDALLSKEGKDEIPAAEAAVQIFPRSAAQSAGAGVETAGPGITSLPALIAKLSDRLNAVEAKLQAADRTEKTLLETQAAVAQLQQSLQSMAKYVQGLNGAVDGISRNLQETPVYGLQSAFTCNSCGSSGFAVVPVRCSRCGKEQLWGWWPPKKSDSSRK